MWFRENCVAHRDLMERQLKNYEEKLKHLPEGKLVRKINRNKRYYYADKGYEKQSLLKDSDTVEKYRLKECLIRRCKKLVNNIEAINKLLAKYQPLIMHDDKWKNLVPSSNRAHPENLRHEYAGVSYRSKSEVLIATMLTSFGIEFKYEPQMNISHMIRYPDFVIKRPRDGKIIIWEHFGMTHKDEYRAGMAQKIEDYHVSGYNLWDNLIISFDNDGGGINADYIEKIIRLFLI